ncbi:MAG TPA: undecaprenyl-diphosphate phosphatase [Myxococcota bacterium]
MSGLEAAALGLIQGLTEFLPVSSSGHLVMLEALLGIDNEGVVFEVALHVATLASVLLFYRRRVAQLVAGAVLRRPDALRYVGKLALATLPAVLAVLAMGDFLEALFDSPATAGVCLLLTGAILWTTRRSTAHAVGAEPGWWAALLIGCAQAFAILPGISRSGTTVAAALALGVAPVAAAEFSFLMSVIAVGGAAVLKLPDLGVLPAGSIAPLLTGAAVALVSGIAAIWLFVRLLRAQAFHHFAYYTWGAGALFLLWLMRGQVL